MILKAFPLRTKSVLNVFVHLLELFLPSDYQDLDTHLKLALTYFFFRLIYLLKTVL